MTPKFMISFTGLRDYLRGLLFSGLALGNGPDGWTLLSLLFGECAGSWIVIYSLCDRDCYSDFLSVCWASFDSAVIWSAREPITSDPFVDLPRCEWGLEFEEESLPFPCVKDSGLISFIIIILGERISSWMLKSSLSTLFGSSLLWLSLATIYISRNIYKSCALPCCSSHSYYVSVLSGRVFMKGL